MPDVERIAAELRAAMVGATDGPWSLKMDDNDYIVSSPGYDYMMCDTAYYPTALDLPDARYVVAANPENIRALLDELARQGEALKLAREALRPFYDADLAIIRNHLSSHIEDDNEIFVRVGYVRAASDVYRAFLSTLEGK